MNVQVISSETGFQAVLDLVEAININRVMLSEIDGAIGDGYHGINMSSGFSRFRDLIRGQELSFAGAIDLLGKTLLEQTGGSLGPLYGSMFIAMARPAEGRPVIDSYLFLKMLEEGRNAIMDTGGAAPGDKTILDCLCPAIDGFRSIVESGAQFSDCLDALTRSAEAGKEATRGMVARVGRASRLGERSRGLLDAGAASCCIILKSLSISFQRALAQDNLRTQTT